MYLHLLRKVIYPVYLYYAIFFFKCPCLFLHNTPPIYLYLNIFFIYEIIDTLNIKPAMNIYVLKSVLFDMLVLI